MTLVRVGVNFDGKANVFKVEGCKCPKMKWRECLSKPGRGHVVQVKITLDNMKIGYPRYGAISYLRKPKHESTLS